MNFNYNLIKYLKTPFLNSDYDRAWDLSLQ